jgi:hypothetical protein
MTYVMPPKIILPDSKFIEWLTTDNSQNIPDLYLAKEIAQEYMNLMEMYKTLPLTWFNSPLNYEFVCATIMDKKLSYKLRKFLTYYFYCNFVY